jgi:hypothetical protein
MVSGISLAGYVSYKLVHLIEENWPKFEAAVRRCVDFWFDVRVQIEQRQGELRQLRQELRSESPRARRADGPP